MAIWQFEFEVVPSERIADRSDIDASEFDESRWWSHRQPAMDFRQRLATLLPPAKSWHDLLLWFGDECGDRLDVWLDDDRVESFSVRLDCRKPNVPLIEGLLKLSQEWSCSFIELRYLKVLPMSLKEFVQALLDSPNHRFMEDPAHWLPKLAAEV